MGGHELTQKRGKVPLLLATCIAKNQVKYPFFIAIDA
jgi:hypothetical protein